MQIPTRSPASSTSVARSAPPAESSRRVLSLWLDALLVLAILAGAALLRFLWLDAVPPGWHHDEALMGIMAGEVYRGVQRPVFFSGYLGQEPIYLYLCAGMMWLLGGNQGILPLRLTSALVGLATVGVTYLLGRELWGRRVGLVAAGLLGFSFWQVLLSRDGYRVITQPLLEGITMLLLWRALRNGSRLWYLVAGVSLGLTFYTYLGARAFPGVLVLFGVWWLVAKPDLTPWPPSFLEEQLSPSPYKGEGRGEGAIASFRSVRRVRGLENVLIFALAALVVAAPLLQYFSAHPGSFTARIDQVSVFQTDRPLLNLAKNLVKLLAKFTFRGDALWRYDLAGRPMLVGTVALFFYLGLLVALRDTLRRQASSALALCWFITMLLPSFLSLDDGTYFSRAMGLVPGVFFFPAVGLVAAWDWVEPRLRSVWGGRSTAALATLAALVVAVDGAWTYHDYFDVYAESVGAGRDTMADVVAAARYLAANARPGDEVLISSSYIPHATVAHLAPRAYAQARWFDGDSTLVLPSEARQDTLLVLPASALPRDVESYLPAEALVDKEAFSDGSPKLLVYRLTPEESRAAAQRLLEDPVLHSAGQSLGGKVELAAYRVDPQVVQNQKLSLTVVWKVLVNAPAKDYVAFFHLISEKGGLYGQIDSAAFPASQWRKGDVVLGRFFMEVKDWVPTGKYTLSTGIYDRATVARLPVLASDPPADQVTLGAVQVMAPP